MIRSIRKSCFGSIVKGSSNFWIGSIANGIRRTVRANHTTALIASFWGNGLGTRSVPEEVGGRSGILKDFRHIKCTHPQRAKKQIPNSITPAESCHLGTNSIPWLAAVQDRKKVRPTFQKKAIRMPAKRKRVLRRKLAR
jgi:hypothetical protein